MFRKINLKSVLKWGYKPVKAMQTKVSYFLQHPNFQKNLRRYLAKDGFKGLNAGCGNVYLEGWLNTDLFGCSDCYDCPLDLSMPLNFPDATFDAIYAEEVVEHFPRVALLEITREIYRVIKPDGTFRLTTPHLDNLCKTYLERDSNLMHQFKSVWMEGEFSPEILINGMFHLWGHQFLYSETMLMDVLKQSGFMEVTVCNPQSTKSGMAQLNHLERRYGSDPHPWFAVTLILEAKKAHDKRQ